MKGRLACLTAVCPCRQADRGANENSSRYNAGNGSVVQVRCVKEGNITSVADIQPRRCPFELRRTSSRLQQLQYASCGMKSRPKLVLRSERHNVQVLARGIGKALLHLILQSLHRVRGSVMKLWAWLGMAGLAWAIAASAQVHMQ